MTTVQPTASATPNTMTPNGGGGVIDGFLAPDTSTHRNQPVLLPSSNSSTKKNSSADENNYDYHLTAATPTSSSVSQKQNSNNSSNDEWLLLQNGTDNSNNKIITNNFAPRNVQKSQQQQLNGHHAPDGATAEATTRVAQQETFTSSSSPSALLLRNVVDAARDNSGTRNNSSSALLLLGTVNGGDAPDSLFLPRDDKSEQPPTTTAAASQQQAVLLTDWPPKRPSSKTGTHAQQRSSKAHDAFERQRTKFNAQHNYFNSGNETAEQQQPPLSVRDISGRNVVQPANLVEATRRSRSRTPPPQPHRHLIDDDKARRQYRLQSPTKSPTRSLVGSRTDAEDEISAAIDKVFIQLSEFDALEDLARPPKKVPLCDQRDFEDSFHRYRATSPSKMPPYSSSNSSRQQYQPQHYYQQPTTQYVQYQQAQQNGNNNNNNICRPDSSIGSSVATESGSTGASSTNPAANGRNYSHQKPVDFSGFDLNSEYHIGLGGASGFGGGDFRLIDDIYERAKNKRLTLDKVEDERRRHNYNLAPAMRSPIPDNRYDSAFDAEQSLSRRVDNLIGSRGSALGKRSNSFRRGRSLDHGDKLRGTTARVLYDFRPSSARELSLREGDIVQIHEQLDQNWCEGECNGRVGIFPVSYLEPLKSAGARQRSSNSQSIDHNHNNNHNNHSRTQSPSMARPSSSIANDYRYTSSPTLLLVNKYDDDAADYSHLNGNKTSNNSELGYANAIFDFKAQNSYEMSCKKGELLVLIRRVDQNWYEARVHNTSRRGIVPANYIQIQRVTTSTTMPRSSDYTSAALPASPIRRSVFFNNASGGGGGGALSAAESDDEILSQRSGEVRRLRPSSAISSGTATYPPNSSGSNNNRPVSNGLRDNVSTVSPFSGVNLSNSSRTLHQQQPSPSSQLLQRRPSFRRDSTSSNATAAVDAYGNVISRNDPGADRYIHGNTVIDELAGKLKSQKSLVDNIVGGGHATPPQQLPTTTPSHHHGGVGALIRSQSRQSVDGGDRRERVIFEHALAPSSTLLNGGGDYDRPTSPPGSIISSLGGGTGTGGASYAQYRQHRHDNDASPDVHKFLTAPDSTPQRDRTSQHYTPDKLLQMQQMQEQKGEPQPYRVLYSYAPQNEDELELREGDRVYVFEKCDDNWYVGTTARGEFGVFPGNYVTPMF